MVVVNAAFVDHRNRCVHGSPPGQRRLEDTVPVVESFQAGCVLL